MEAKQLLKMCGFKKCTDNNNLIIYYFKSYSKCKITFQKKFHSFIVENTSISIGLYKAITQQMIELGWIK